MAWIEEFLPRYHFREVHRRRIDAPPSVAAATLRDVDLACSPVIGPLFAARGMRVGRLGELFSTAFVTLAEDAQRGLVVGAMGAFWSNGGGARRRSPGNSPATASPGCARLAWMFEFTPLEGGRACEAVTETRIECCDGAARLRMQLYWWLIRPASGLIRREMLRLLARQCSDGAPSH